MLASNVMRALLLVAALCFAGKAQAHVENRSSCRIDTSELESLSKPKVRVLCEIPVASDDERASLIATLPSLVHLYAVGQHNGWRRDCRWIDAPRAVGHHSDALVLEAKASCPDNGSLKMDLAYLSWHPAPHVADVSVGDGRMLSSQTVHSGARIADIRFGESTRLLVCGACAAVTFFVAYIGSISRDRSRLIRRTLGALSAVCAAFLASCVIFHW